MAVKVLNLNVTHSQSETLTCIFKNVIFHSETINASDVCTIGDTMVLAFQQSNTSTKVIDSKKIFFMLLYNIFLRANGTYLESNAGYQNTHGSSLVEGDEGCISPFVSCHSIHA